MKITATPTPFNHVRAAEIFNARELGQDLSWPCTPGEDAYVRQIWADMPGETCWADAFYRILHQYNPNPTPMTLEYAETIATLRSVRTVYGHPPGPNGHNSETWRLVEGHYSKVQTIYWITNKWMTANGTQNEFTWIRNNLQG